MFSLKEKCESMFGSCKSFYEAISEVNAQYETQIKSLPSSNELMAFLECFTEHDGIELLFESIENWTFKSTNKIVWIDSYEKFVNEENAPEDDVKVTLIVRKNVESPVSVYCFDELEKFFRGKSTRELINLFAQLLKKNGYIRFNVLDRIINLFTKTIAFTNTDTIWPIESFDREQSLSRCEKASLFLNRTEVRLLPQDFAILRNNIAGECNLVSAFERIETIFNYVYIANNSYLPDDKLVVQFDPAGNAFDFKLDEIQTNPIWRRIYEWVFDTDTAIERAAIARNIISINCKNVEQLNGITEEIVGSIKSNFVIYQKSSVEKYIDAKKSIADNIIETSKQIQEMTHELTSGLRNNFLAVIMFLITVILTDSMDWDDLISGGIPKDIVYMSYLFAVASVFYLIITIFGTLKKWGYCSEGYYQLKKNYEELLEQTDLNRAFSNDALLIDAKKQIIKDTVIVSLIWIAFLCIMVVFFTWMRSSASDTVTTTEKFYNVFIHFMWK